MRNQQAVSVHQSNDVLGCLCMLVFKDFEMRDLFNIRGKVYCPLGRSEGATVFEAGMVFHVASEGYAVFSGVQGQPGCRATCTKPINKLKL